MMSAQSSTWLNELGVVAFDLFTAGQDASELFFFEFPFLRYLRCDEKGFFEIGTHAALNTVFVHQFGQCAP